MPDFDSIKEWKKYIDKQRGMSGILDEKQIIKILTEAGQELERYLKQELNAYFSSYDPVVYKRTGDTVKSIMVGVPRKVGVDEWSLEITFNESLANHPSYIADDQPDGYVPWLLHSGWRNKLDSTLDIENFTRFKGTNYITKAVDKFNASNKHGLRVQVYHGSNDVTGRTYSYGK